MPNPARETIFSRIRTATGAERPAATIAAEWAAIPRTYRQSPALDHEALLDLLEDRLRDYDAGVYRATAADLPAQIARILTERGKRRIAIPAGIPPQWLAPGPQFLEDAGSATVAEIDSADGVLTTATLAISETGTIVLQDVPGQGRRALTLLPDYHLCIVDASTVVQTVPEAMARLQPTASLATTFFSGPSATADIEMTRIKGVHGPRFVDVILLLA